MSGDPFHEGYDDRRNVDQIYREGDGKKRKPFVKGHDERRISEERREKELHFKEGNTLASLRDSAKVSPDTKAELIPAEFQVQIEPWQTAEELLPMLDSAIEVGKRMMMVIEQSENIDNAIEVGCYGDLVKKCVKTRAEIAGEGMKPALFGRLETLSPETVEKTKEDLAYILRCNLTKLNHGFVYAAEKGEEGLFKKDGLLRNWAGKPMRTLLSTVRSTIELRARLDAWERKKDHRKGAIQGRYREVLNGS